MYNIFYLAIACFPLYTDAIRFSWKMRRYKNMKRKVNDTLAELLTGILVFGIIVQIIELIVAAVCPDFAGSVPSFVIGLWIGIAAAFGLAVHMYHSIDKALGMKPGKAESYMRITYLVRTLAMLAVAAFVYFLNFGYVMATFLGMLSLKFGALLQPLMHKLFIKLKNKK